MKNKNIAKGLIIMFTVIIIIMIIFTIRYFMMNSSLSYGNDKIWYKTPKDFDVTYETDSSRTYEKDGNTLQYTVNLTTVDRALEMDKEIVTEMKNSGDFSNVSDSTFSVNNIKCYKYTYDNNGTKYVLMAYKPINQYVLVISLTSNNNISQDQIAKYL